MAGGVKNYDLRLAIAAIVCVTGTSFISLQSKQKSRPSILLCRDRIKKQSCGATPLDANASNSTVPTYGGFVHGVPLRRT